ncbi:MAG: hypothetical protein QN178_13810 [Armatimonadota bacterium]|nr:hypothetical protein [Armatimonadota bacterium]
MIVSIDETHLVSSLGWVDAGTVWVCETRTYQVRQVTLSDARYLTLHAGTRDVFAAVHHFDGSRLVLTAHPATEPERVLSRITVAHGQTALDGDAAVWHDLPRAYTGWYGPPDAGTYCLCLIDARRPTVEVQPLEWYAQTFDVATQGVIGVTEVPGQPLLLISVQRDSRPLLYDPRRRAVTGRIGLAGRLGNPVLRFRSRAPELWASDYDVLLRLDPSDWSIMNAVRLSGAAGGAGTAPRQFIGEFAFNVDESLCVVARPFDGDVVAVEAGSFSVTHRAVTRGRPLDVAVLGDHRVFARDWQTGELLLTEET